ncbi:MAG: hypothetical protein KJO30_08800, partial [Boseongicola sp.]|nr:hypothetical protein [Boseongicola sp.]
LTGCPDIKTNGIGNMDMLVRTLRNTPTYDCEVLLLIRARRVSVDKGSFARLKLAVADNLWLYWHPNIPFLKRSCDACLSFWQKYPGGELAKGQEGAWPPPPRDGKAGAT